MSTARVGTWEFSRSEKADAVTFGGGSVTDSYDSANMTLVNGAPTTQANSGSLGTNGNLTANGNATILYSKDAITENIAKYGGQVVTLSWREAR